MSTDPEPEGCAFCPDELFALDDVYGDPLCQTCPHRMRKDGDRDS